MQRIYFTPEEARKRTGESVQASTDFPSVPKGSKGTVVKALENTEDKWLYALNGFFPNVHLSWM